MKADEETRAREFRDAEVRRAAYRRQANARLVAPPGPFRDLTKRWEAMRLWIVERRER